MCRTILYLCLSAMMLAPAAVARETELRLVEDGKGPIAVEVVGAPKVQQRAEDSTAPLSVYVIDEAQRRSETALAGRLSAAGPALRFTPQFAFRPGMTYEAVYKVASGEQPRVLRFSIPPPPPAEPTRVVAIYPSSDVLPDNHLRFYLHFSGPMSFGEAYSHVKLLAADGTEVKRAFLEIGEELWDGTGTRLTLLFDPGRVKKGLLPREEFGPVLMDGHRYRLVIDKAWRDANGNPLVASFEKAFRAGPPVETAVQYEKWRLSLPRAGTREPLAIRFDRSLDHALLQRMIGVAGPGGGAVAGKITVLDQEQQGNFVPQEPWEAGSHQVVVDSALEDCAGNNLARPFEVDVFDRVDNSSAPELIRIPFELKK